MIARDKVISKSFFSSLVMVFNYEVKIYESSLLLLSGNLFDIDCRAKVIACSGAKRSADGAAGSC